MDPVPWFELVRERRGLWDPREKCYKDRDATKALWKEIASLMDSTSADLVRAQTSAPHRSSSASTCTWPPRAAACRGVQRDALRQRTSAPRASRARTAPSAPSPAARSSSLPPFACEEIIIVLLWWFLCTIQMKYKNYNY